MRKKDELKYSKSCLNKAGDDEPIFVLRAKDPLAATTVRAWADAAEQSDAHEPTKIEEARIFATVMENWRE